MSASVVNNYHHNTVQFPRTIQQHKASCSCLAITTLALLTIGALAGAFVCYYNLPHLPTLSIGLSAATVIFGLSTAYLVGRDLFCSSSPCEQQQASFVPQFEKIEVNEVSYEHVRVNGKDVLKSSDDKEYPLVILKEGETIVYPEGKCVLVVYTEGSEQPQVWSREDNQAFEKVNLTNFLGESESTLDCESLDVSQISTVPDVEGIKVFDQRGFCYVKQEESILLYSFDDTQSTWTAPVKIKTFTGNVLGEIKTVLNDKDQICTLSDNGTVAFHRIQPDGQTSPISVSDFNQDKVIQGNDELGARFWSVEGKEVVYKELTSEHVQFYKNSDYSPMSQPLPYFDLENNNGAKLDHMTSEGRYILTADLTVYDRTTQGKSKLKDFGLVEALESGLFVTEFTFATTDDSQ